MPHSSQELIDLFQKAGQGQVFRYFDRLSEEGKRSLLAEAEEIDLAEIDRLVRTLVAGGAARPLDLSGLGPAPYEPLVSNGGDPAQWAKAVATGEAALRAGRVATFTVAGGQGTRLGYDGPKGTFPVTPVRRRPLFQVFAWKILAASRRYGRPIHWFIMTSHQNHEATEAFFRENRHFGLDPARVHFFRQGRMPAVDFSGKILLESEGSLALSPDGHGGSLRALDRSGALDLMASEGIDTLSYFQVDNPLVRSVDPSFIGWHLMRGSEMSSKMIPKAYPEEKLGVFCTRQGKTVVIEYSDLPLDLQREKDPATGRLRNEAGSIAIHVIDREFVRRMAKGAEGLPFHRADKKIATLDEAGRTVKPEKANGVKFELFVFDALPSARNTVVVETNAEGVDSPASCRADQLRQFARWLKAAGATVPLDDQGVPRATIEVSPLFGYDEKTFAESWGRLTPKPPIADGLCLEGPGG
jgi:UDP-N-acetylglucosamine/UDP-N-acetylgalactosamine diphosphorylase